jgi:hypothetical protein
MRADDYHWCCICTRNYPITLRLRSGMLSRTELMKIHRVRAIDFVINRVYIPLVYEIFPWEKLRQVSERRDSNVE